MQKIMVLTLGLTILYKNKTVKLNFALEILNAATCVNSF